MFIREATIADIKQIQFVRNSVTENTLSDPNLVTDKDCEEFIMRRGKGWVCEIENNIVGFSIVDLQENNVWALFLHPQFAQRGIGRKLHDTMLHWYFTKTKTNVWLSTSPNTRAYTFYINLGWEEIGMHGKDEIKFEMSFEKWQTMLGKNS